MCLGLSALVCLYLAFDARVMESRVAEAQSEEVFNPRDAFGEGPIVTTTEKAKGKWNGKISIDPAFGVVSTRLNTEIFDIAAKYYNRTHMEECFGKPNDKNKLYQKYYEEVNPLMVMAITITEIGGSIDSKHTWSGAVASKVLKDKGVDMTQLRVEEVDMNYMRNLNAANESAYRVGPMQADKGKLHAMAGKCGATFADRWRWEDCVSYAFHDYTNNFVSASEWIKKDVTIDNTNELVLLLTENQLTPSILSVRDAGGNFNGNSYPWKTHADYYRWMDAMAKDAELMRLIDIKADKTYKEMLSEAKAGKGIRSIQVTSDTFYKEIIEKSSFNFSQYFKSGYSVSASGNQQGVSYALRCLYYYKVLEKLYTSGGEMPRESIMVGSAKEESTIIIGDSRVVGLDYSNPSAKATLIGKTGEKLDWFKSGVKSGFEVEAGGKKEVKDVEGMNIVMWLGVNSLANETADIEKVANEYANAFLKAARGDWRGAKCYVVAVGEVDESKEASSGYSVKNKVVKRFDAQMKKRVGDALTWIDLGSLRLETGSDGLHYTEETCKTVYKHILNEVTLGAMMSNTTANLSESGKIAISELARESNVSDGRKAVVSKGLELVGVTKYDFGSKAGGSTKPEYLDCSGFVKWAILNATGVDIGEGTANQYVNGTPIEESDLQVGDLGFKRKNGGSNHIGIYVGKAANGEKLWLHCTSGSQDGVNISKHKGLVYYIRPRCY